MSENPYYTKEELFVSDEETPLRYFPGHADWFAEFHPRYKRAYEIVERSDCHKDATIRHVDLARLVFQFTEESEDWTQDAFKKWLPYHSLDDPNWIRYRKFIHSKVIESSFNFDIYMRKWVSLHDSAA